jgi:hypothetical protein
MSCFEFRTLFATTISLLSSVPAFAACHPRSAKWLHPTHRYPERSIDVAFFLLIRDPKALRKHKVSKSFVLERPQQNLAEFQYHQRGGALRLPRVVPCVKTCVERGAN